jgi:putative peptidoglycan lipid II flippase
VALTAGLGWFLAFPVTSWLGMPARLGLIGLTASAGMAAWVEFLLLRSSMNRRIGWTGLRFAPMAKIWLLAFGSAALAFALKYWTRSMHPLISGSLVILVYGLAYVAGAVVMRIPEAVQLLHAIKNRLLRK